jgi:hypothetical protein
MVALVGAKMQGQYLLNGSGRYEVWKMSLNFLFNEANPWLGLGSGTFTMFGPALQMREAVQNNIQGFPGFFWMHNDWLQVLFETGIIGVGFCVLIFLKALWDSKKNAELFACILTYGAISITQMPIRWFIFSLLGAYLVRATISDKRTITETDIINTQK